MVRNDRREAAYIGILPIRPPLRQSNNLQTGQTARKGNMTRDYNNQRRDNARPFSRNQSPNRPGSERTPRQARPRLNRETVDRAWESGAPNRHADYRTRSSAGSNSQPPRNRQHSNQPSEHYSTQNDRRPFGNRQNSDRRFERTPNGNAAPRSRSFDSDRRNFDDRRSYSDGPHRNGTGPGFRDNSRRYEQRPQFRDDDQSRGYQGRGPRRYDRQPRDFDPDNRSPRNAERQPGNFKRDKRSPRNFDGPGRSSYQAQRPGTQNPRWQSRPEAQRGRSYQDQQHFNELAPQNEQFEGDYERFDRPKQQRRPADRPYRRSETPDRKRPETEERHVTRLPDGRVLKGSRPLQRRKAEFWTGVENEAESLIDQVHPDSTSTEKQADQRPAEAPREPSAREKATPKSQHKPRVRAASAVKRERKPGAKKGAARGSSTSPKPSQRGFKWPTS